MLSITPKIPAVRHTARLFLASLLLAASAHAVPYAGNFSNPGALTGWSTSSGYAPGITSVTLDPANPDVSISYVLPRVSNPDDNRRIGLRRYYAGEEGKTFTYQFSFLSPSIAPVTAAMMDVWIWQALVHDPDRVKKPDGSPDLGSAAWRPLVSLNYKGGGDKYAGWYLNYYTGGFPNLVGKSTRIRLLATDDSNVWHTWRIKVKYSLNPDGYIIVWRVVRTMDETGKETERSEEVYRVSGVPTWPSGLGPNYNLMACYENYVVSGWSTAGSNLTSIKSYYDVISFYKNP
jgi:Polysaccharide lyase